MEDEKGPTAGLGDIIIAKHRNGSTDSVRLKFIGKYARFDNITAFEGDDESFQPAPLNPSNDFDAEPSTNIIRSSKMDEIDDDQDFNFNGNEVDDDPF
jgi:replicative DNA helicase